MALVSLEQTVPLATRFHRAVAEGEKYYVVYARIIY